MTHSDFETLSNQAVAACAVVYFLAFLAYLAQWAALRAVPAETSQEAAALREPAEVGAGGVPTAAPVTTRPDGDVDVDSHRADFTGRLGLLLTGGAALIHLVAVASRGLAADPVRVPWGNMYEFTMTATVVVVFAFLLLRGRFDLDWMGPIVSGFVLVVLMIDVLLLYTPVVPLRDALQSPWLVIHVIAAIIATGAFTMGGIASIFYLIKERWPQTRPGGLLDRVPGLPALDRLSYRLHAFAFPIWTFAALIAGPIWAQHAWGRYWGWDPKEVWAFITWVVYAAYLHARATAGWKGRAAAIVALVGLATLWFNFVGINFFFGSGSQHSYA